MFTDYNSTIGYLFGQLPVFHREGAGAYKPGLDTARALDSAFGNPSVRLKTVHIAGTNGKGSTAHSIAAVLSAAGYKTGLYTSPHIVDFRERIRVDGNMIPESEVVDFMNRYLDMKLDVSPSFFELTTIMAFDYFARADVDVAVIETGLGGRLDTTNIITPLLSIITNISEDHTSLLGNTPALIAKEKAGIIKPGVPVVIGRADDRAVREVFEKAAERNNSPIHFAKAVEATSAESGIIYHNTSAGTFRGELAGVYQIENTATVLTALDLLSSHFTLLPEVVTDALGRVTELTGLRGRWTRLSDRPLTIYDTGHNPGGWSIVTEQLASLAPRHLHLVVGFVADKDVSVIMKMIASLAGTKGISLSLYFSEPSTPRRLEAEKLRRLAVSEGLDGLVIPDVTEALAQARKQAAPDDVIFIGGSNYLIGDMLGGMSQSKS